MSNKLKILNFYRKEHKDFTQSAQGGNTLNPIFCVLCVKSLRPLRLIFL
jgi:hypothetical protein